MMFLVLLAGVTVAARLRLEGPCVRVDAVLGREYSKTPSSDSSILWELVAQAACTYQYFLFCRPGCLCCFCSDMTVTLVQNGIQFSLECHVCSFSPIFLIDESCKRRPFSVFVEIEFPAVVSQAVMEITVQSRLALNS